MLNQEKLTLFLEKLGLSSSESKFFLAALSCGVSSVPEISKSANIDRVTGYKVLESLKKKGLIELLVDKRRGKLIKAASPSHLRELVLKMKLVARKLELGVDDIVSQLKTIQKTTNEKPEIFFYEGVEGIKKVFENTLTATEEIAAFAGGRAAYDVLGDFLDRYFEHRTEKGIPIKVIMPNTEEARKVKQQDAKHLRESKLVNLPFEFGLEVNIYDDKVALMEFEQKFGMIIKSRAFAQAQKEIFKLAWKNA